jgi:predicted phosphoribosyltransferase/pimeloyl-ACP methyl ester carboxylesterase
MPRGRILFGPGTGRASPPDPFGSALVPTFRDRDEAGRALGERLLRFRAASPVVLGIPRGGLPVAAEVARALDAPLDVLVVRKLGVPWHPELGFGAVGEGGASVIDTDVVSAAGLDPSEMQSVIREETSELDRRIRRYRGDRPPVSVTGRTAILVDDGIATGGTVRAAIDVIRQRGADRIVVAVPVAPPRTVEMLRQLVDEIVVLRSVEPFLAVGQFYEEFPQVPDEEVARILAGSSPEPMTDDPVDPVDPVDRTVDIDLVSVRLVGDLVLPAAATGVVVFAHGSGSSRHSPRNRSVARALNRVGLGTFLLDLLTVEEELDRTNVFDVDLLADRLVSTTQWLRRRPEAHDLPIGYFGASTGAAAALMAAAELGEEIRAVVSRGGRPDLAASRLDDVVSPTLLIVGGDDRTVLQLNRQARSMLRCPSELEVVPGATHLFEEPGALERVAALAAGWFARHLARTPGEPLP